MDCRVSLLCRFVAMTNVFYLGLDWMPKGHTFKSGVHFDWNPLKNEWLKKERKISFEESALVLANGKLWKVADHTNLKKYTNQKVFLMPIEDYIYFVPFVLSKDVIFLKTAFPHRGATKDYLNERKKNG